MWELFTEASRKAILYSQEEAGRVGERYVATEHLLVGRLRASPSVALNIFDRLGVSPYTVRVAVRRQMTSGDSQQSEVTQLAPRAKHVIDLAYDEARQLDNKYIGTEHLLLGLVREREGLAGRVLSKLGIDLDRVRTEVDDLQGAEVRHEPGLTIPQSDSALLDAVLNLTKRTEAEAALLSRSEPRLEHLVLAMLGDEHSVSARMLAKCGVTLEGLRGTLKEMYARGG